MDKFLKMMVIVLYSVFATALIFYALTALSFMFKGKNSDATQEILAFIRYCVLPISFYVIGAVALSYSKSWSWTFVLIGGIIVVTLNLSVIPLRFIHIGIYVLSLFAYLLKK